MKEIRNLKIRISCFLEEGEYIWFIPKEVGILCRYHLGEEMIDFMRIVPDEGMRGDAFAAIVRYKEKLVFIPYFSKEVAIFDMFSEKFSKIKLPQLEEGSENYAKFDSCITSGKYLYMVPGKYPYIVKIDLDTHEILQSENIQEQCCRFWGRDIISGGFSASVWDGDNVLYAGVGFIDNKEEYIGLVRIDLETLQTRIKEVPGIELWIKGLVWNEGRLYVYSAEGKITILDCEMNKIDSIFDLNLCDYDQPSKLNIIYGCYAEGRLYFIRSLGLKMIVVDLINNNNVYKKELVENAIISAGKLQDGILLQTEEAGWFEVKENNFFVKKTLNVRSFEIQSCLQELLKETTGIMRENIVFSLQCWLELTNAKTEKLFCQQEKSIGSMIMCELKD